MRNIFKLSLVVLSFLGLSLGIQLALASPVRAVDAFEEVCKQDLPAGVDKPTVCNDNVKLDPVTGKPLNPISGNDGVILKVLGLIRVVGGALAVIYIIASALKLVASNGDAGKLKETRETIIYASAGLVVLLIAPEIVKYFLNLVNA